MESEDGQEQQAMNRSGMGKKTKASAKPSQERGSESMCVSLEKN